MPGNIDSTKWTGDVAGRARTQVLLTSTEVRTEILQTLKWGAAAGGAIMLFGFALKVLV